MAKIPEIRFKYGWLVSNTASGVLNEKWGDGTPLRTFDEYHDIAKKYEKWWQPHNKKVLSAMTDLLGLEFRQEIIDVYVVPWFYPISDPMILGPAFENEDQVVNVLTHELLHRLLTDNTVTSYEHDFLKDWQKLFGEHDFNTLVHIPVHAAMKKIYLESIKRPDLLELDRKAVKDNKPYADAWKYVDEQGHEEILEKLAALQKKYKG